MTSSVLTPMEPVAPRMVICCGRVLGMNVKLAREPEQ